MVTHIALFRWKENITHNEISRIMTDIKKLKNKIKDVIDINCGTNFSKWNEGYTHAVVVKVKNRKALDNYRNHPKHKPIAEKVDQMEEKSIGIDFEEK